MKTQRKMRRNVKYFNTRLSHDKILFIQSLGTRDVKKISQAFEKKYGAPLRESTILRNLDRKIKTTSNVKTRRAYNVRTRRENNATTPQTNTVQMFFRFAGVDYTTKDFFNKFVVDLASRELNDHNG